MGCQWTQSIQRVKFMMRVKVKAIMVCCVLVVYPLSVQAQSEGGIKGQKEVTKQNLTIEEVLVEAPDIISDIKRIWQKITGGNVEGAIEAILGAIGIGNPAYESTRVGSGEEEDNPYANPETPEEVYDLERHTDIVRSQIPQKLSQVVFSPEGQKMMAEETAQVEAIQRVSHQAQQAANLVYQESATIALEGKIQADKVKTLREEAKSADASQDVLKAISAQNEELAQILAGNSSQLTQLGEIGLYQSVQLNGLNAQLAALNGKAQVLEVLVSSQNYLMSQMDDAIGQQKEYQQYKDSLKNGLNRNMSQMVFIPGLY